MEATGTSICLVMKAVLLSGRWAGRSRRLGLEQASRASGEVGKVCAENATLHDLVEFLTERVSCLERRLKAAHIRTPYCLTERMHILSCIEYFGIPRRQIPKCLGVARSTVWRWLRRVPVIRGLDQLEILLADFVCYCNSWRPHMTLEGAVPELIHAGREWQVPPRTAKAVPAHIERRFFPETRVTGFRLAA